MLTDRQTSRRRRWRCRRGMRELDVLLNRFLDRIESDLSSDDWAHFDRFLDLPDPELAAYLLRGESAADLHIDRLARRIRETRP